MTPSAAAIAALGSLQVESALIIVMVSPFSNDPESEASLKAISAESAIAGVSDSIGPVNPKITPILISERADVINVDRDDKKKEQGEKEKSKVVLNSD